MKRTALFAIAALIVIAALSSCSDDSSDSLMTEDEYEKVKAILTLKDDVFEWAQDYAVWDSTYEEDQWTSDYAFIDSDGNGEYDEGEPVIYSYTENVYEDAYTEGYTKTYAFTFEDGNAINGTYSRVTVYDGYDDYLTKDETAESGYKTDTYTVYMTYIADFTAVIDSDDYSLSQTLYRTVTVNRSGDSSSEYTGSETVLNGTSIPGYEDYLN